MKNLLILILILLSTTVYAFDEAPEFILPEPTETTAYVASTGGTVHIQLSTPFVINDVSYAAYEIAEITFETSEEPQTVLITFTPADDKKIHIDGPIVSASFAGFVSYAKPLVKGV